MKNFRKFVRECYIKEVMVSWLVFYMVLGIPAQVVMGGTPQPDGSGFVVGAGSIDTSAANATNVIVDTVQSVIHWETIDTGIGENLNFSQNEGVINADVLNRVTGGAGTEFLGNLNAEAGMSIWMQNDAGILFGPDCVINVTNLVATTLDISNSDFLNGTFYSFTGGEGAGDVTFRGTTTDRAEVIALVGNRVMNTGTILAEDTVVMAAGDTVTLSDTGGTIGVDITIPQTPDPCDFTIIHSGGGIEAQHVVMAAGDIWASAYVAASDTANSDAVASVVMDAVHNITIRDEVGAEAEGNGVDDATATVTVNAGGDVTIDAYDDDAGLYAEAYDGATNTATVTVNAGGDVEVDAEDYGEAYIYAEAYLEEAEGGATNTATVNVTAGGDVDVIAEYDGEAYIYAGADDGTNNTATVTVNAGNDVDVYAREGSYAGIEADAEGGSLTNTSAVTVDAGEDVDVTAEHYSWAEIDADADYGATNSVSITVNAGEDVGVYAYQYSDALIAAETEGNGESANTGSVQVAAANGDVDVHSYNSDAEISATAHYGTDNTATVDVAAVGGDVCVSDSGGYGDTAKIEAYVHSGENNTAETTVIATAATMTYVEEGDGEVFEFTETEGGNVYVEASDEGHAEIAAYAEYAHSGGDMKAVVAQVDEPYINEGTNTATVTVRAIGENVIAEPKPDIDIPVPGTGGVIITTVSFATPVKASSIDDDFEVYGGNVEVSAEFGSNAAIQAGTYSGGTNTSDVLVCADSDVSVEGYFGGEANIRALAENGEVANAATVGVGAKGDRGVLVAAGYGGAAFIEADAYAYSDYYYYYYPQAANTAETVVCTAGDVIVLDEGSEEARTAGILSEAFDGVSNDAYTGVCADGDVMVVAGVPLGAIEDGVIPEYGSGGHAMIRSEAGSRLQYATSSAKPSVALAEAVEVDPTSANAETVVVSNEGGVLVADATGYGVGSSQIYAEAYGATENTANVGVSAGGDLFDEEDPSYYEMTEGVGVLVVGMGPSSKAEIHSYAHNGFENTADTVVCTPEDVVVVAEGSWSLAKIKACAEDGGINTATTRVYASDVFVDVPGLYRGNGIWAYAEGYEATLKPHVDSEFWMTDYDGEFGTGEFVKTEEDLESGSSASVTLQDYSNAVDCPDCPPCPDCGDEALLAPVAPLAQFEVPRVEGCPALMQATAMELGIPAETLQVAVGNSVAMNPSIQPCQACSTLVGAANMLKNEGDMRMAAMIQAFNSLAPADAPFTPELSASVATAFATAEEGSIYASAAEYIDALVQYVAVLDTDLGSPVGDSVAYVMEKYGTQITGSSNTNLTAFVTARIETSATFAE